MSLADPRKAQCFRFVRRGYADGVATLVYAFDDGPELVERIVFADPPALPAERAAAFDAAVRLSDVKINPSLPDSAFKLNLPKGVKRVFPQK